MPEPKVTHVRDTGGTTDINRLAVKVERTAYLDESLTKVVRRDRARIHLIAKEGYPDSLLSMGLDIEQVGRLIRALEAALLDVATGEDFDATLDGAR